MRYLYLPACLGLLLMSAACSSIVEGSSQTVTVSTDPSGAECKLLRGGSMIAVVNPTPGSVTVSKSKDHASVECEKVGYQQAAAPLESSFQGMTFGNILFGGLIGVAVDASTGAMHQYPPSITVVLPPEEFPNEAARDVWFAQRAAEIEEEAADALKAAKTSCQSRSSADTAQACARAMEAIKQEREARLAANEAQRLATAISS